MGNGPSGRWCSPGLTATPETTYNGVSLFHLLEAHAITRGDPGWKFLEEVVRRMLDFKLHQYFPDPDGRFDGPSGYANRTGNSYVFDQRDRSWRDSTAAGDFVEGRPLVRRLKNGGRKEGGRSHLPAPEQMTSDLRNSIQVLNQQGFAQASTVMPPPWKHDHWPPDCPYSAASGWYDGLRKLEQTEASSFLTPLERPEPIQRAFGDEFWPVKNNDGQRDFGFFVETVSQSCYCPWLGGSLQAFWTRPAGILLLACHDKTGDDADKAENTRVWPQIDTWATHHIWGSDAQGAPLSTAADVTDNKVRHELNRKPAQVEVSASLVRGPRGDGQRNTDGEVVASTSVITRFEARADGVRITHKVLLGPSDRVAQLWCTLPVFLRSADQSKLPKNGGHLRPTARASSPTWSAWTAPTAPAPGATWANPTTTTK